MKITKSKLKQLIKEELQSLMEVDNERAIRRAAARRQALNLSKTGPRSGSSKMPELPPEEKADARTLDQISLAARILMGDGYSVELFDRDWRDSPEEKALLDATRYIKNYDRSGDWNEIKAKAEEVIKSVSDKFINRVDSDEEFRERLSGSYDPNEMKKATEKAARGLQSTY